MHNDKESPFTLTLLELDASLQVVQFSGHEALNQPYRFDIEVLGPIPALQLEHWLHQPAYLTLAHGQGIHGILHSAIETLHKGQRPGYKVELVPRLQALDQQRRRRTFHNLSVPMILRQLLEEHHLPCDSYLLELTTGHYPLRPFCIQYEESDLAFLHRLCEEEGIHYHFEHQRNGHVLILADDSLSFPQEPWLVPCHNEPPDTVYGATIKELFQRLDSPPPPRPDARERGALINGQGAANHTLGTPPAHQQRLSRAPSHPEQISRRQLERLRCQYLQVHGRSDHPALRSARIVQVSEHPSSHFNEQWLITETSHEGRHPSLFSADVATMTPGYRNRFTAIPWSTAFRPALKQSRPSVPGYQSARVCGPPGQAATVDDQGRIKVQLWPSPTASDEACGVWLPVVLACASDHLDPARLPAAGSDVLVSFLDCDPDRPVLCAVMTRPEQPPPRRRVAAGESRLLLDWLVNRSDLTP